MTRIPYRGGPPGAGGELAGGPLQRARIALMSNQPAAAEEICRKRLEKRPDEVPTRLLLAQALIQQQRARDGVVEVRRVLDAQPNNVDALIMLSSALLGSNQMNPPKEALTAAQRAVQLQPKAARAHVQLAEVLMMQRQFGHAEEEADEAVRLEPKLAAAHMIKGMALMNSKDYDGAAQAFQGALRQDRTMAPAHFGLAQALNELRRPDEALESVTKAQQLNPYLPAGQVTQLRAQIFRKQRHYRQAYNEYLTLARNGRNQRLAPFLAALSFGVSLLGRAAAFVIPLILLLILFGIGHIPFVGGVLVDILIVALLGVFVWQATRQFSGTTPILALSNQRTLLTTVVGVVLSLVVVFGLFAFFGRFSHPDYWFTTLSFGIAAVVALIVAGVVMNVSRRA
jgi:tetratricopeptide (TPR) repeat protein